MLTCMILSIINANVFRAQHLLDFLLNPEEQVTIFMFFFMFVFDTAQWLNVFQQAKDYHKVSQLGS